MKTPEDRAHFPSDQFHKNAVSSFKVLKKWNKKSTYNRMREEGGRNGTKKSINDPSRKRRSLAEIVRWILCCSPVLSTSVEGRGFVLDLDRDLFFFLSFLLFL